MSEDMRQGRHAAPEGKVRGRHRAPDPVSSPLNLAPLTAATPRIGERRAARDLERKLLKEATTTPQQRATAVAATTGLIMISSMSGAVAHAARTQDVEAPETGSNSLVLAAEDPMIVADDVVVTHQKVDVQTTAAPPQPPPPAPKPAPAPPAAKPAPKHAAPAPAPVPHPQSALRPPMASMFINSPFGPRFSPVTGVAEIHTGLDLAGGCGIPVYAAGSGTVVEAGWSLFGGGNRIVVDHGNGLQTTYNHLASIGVLVGQAVSQGGQIATVGTTGNSTGCHLHFEVLVNGKTVNPEGFV